MFYFVIVRKLTLTNLFESSKNNIKMDVHVLHDAIQNKNYTNLVDDLSYCGTESFFMSFQILKQSPGALDVIN